MSSVIQLIVLAVVLVIPAKPASSVTTKRATVDLIELNHFLDDNGREVFRQVVFYDWSTQRKQFQVRGWRLIKHPSQLPQRKWETKGYQVQWEDKAITRIVIGKAMRETWSKEDPERVNRALLPENERKPLWPEEKKVVP